MLRDREQVVSALFLSASSFMNGQNPVVIPLPTLVPDHDPNIRKNRIPTESELSGLKVIAKTLSRSLRDMRKDIKRAKEAHGLLMAKYQQQFRELEGTQSQIHESKELIKFLQTQCRNFELKNVRLSGIIHPVRRCPTEVLQCIFESACQTSDEKSPIHAAIRISHVCQRWRTIAIETPRLWCDVTFSLMGTSHNSEFWNSLIPRMRRVPATITLLHLDEDGGNRLKQCNLQRIPVVSSFMLDLMDPDYLSQIKSLPRFLPKNGVDHLTIRYVPGDDVPEEGLLLKWDIGDLLENIPAITRLELSAPCDLLVTHSPKLATVTSLDLQSMVNVDILSVISLLPCLSHLGLDDIGITPDSETTQVTSNSLRALRFSGVEEDSWLPALTCPNLDTLLSGSYLSDTCASFIRVHNSITTLDAGGDDDSITTLASIAPQACVLCIGSDLSLLYKRKVPRVRGAPFRNLTRLIVENHDADMAIEDFEGVVRARCLPRGHRLSKLTASLKPLTALSIRRNPSDRTEEAWRDSELFHLAKRTTEDDPYWKGWELLNLSWV